MFASQVTTASVVSYSSLLLTVLWQLFHDSLPAIGEPCDGWSFFLCSLERPPSYILPDSRDGTSDGNRRPYNVPAERNGSNIATEGIIMAYDETLCERIRGRLYSAQGISEKKMFGGVGFLVDGNMACGVNGDRLIVRLGPEEYQEAILRPFVRTFDMTGKPMKGWITVTADGYESESDLDRWIEQGVQFARSLPAK